MADKKPKSVPKPKKLSDEEKAKIVEEYLGVHPKYFVYTGMQITVDIWNLEHDGKHFNGYLPHLKELGQ